MSDRAWEVACAIALEIAAMHIGNGDPGLTIILMWLFPGIPFVIVVFAYGILRIRKKVSKCE